MYETDLRKYIYKGDTDWGITSIEIITEVKIEDKKFPGLEGCLKNMNMGDPDWNPGEKPPLKNRGWAGSLSSLIFFTLPCA